MNETIIGRQNEQQRILDLYHSNEAEFLALYGRRRVGKTLLVRHTLGHGEGIYFELTGQKKSKLAQQLANFAAAFQHAFYPNLTIVPPTSWADAFNMLTEAINNAHNTSKVVIFLDELPWLAGKRSNLISALDYVWNTEWVKNPKIKLVVCGSAASWMIRHIISDKGGLHNRTTDVMLLKPFTLSETKEFLYKRKVALNFSQILQLYMVMGGIPYYLRAVKPGKSAVENISMLCFQENGLLFSEFDKLFDSLFEHADIYKEIVMIISSKRYGIKQNEILQRTKLSSSGGRFQARLKELMEAGFIKKLVQYENKSKKKMEYYRAVDEYCYFYLQWILPAKEQLLIEQTNQYWQLQAQTSSWHSWSGYTFETICLKHVNKIIEKLELSHVVVGAYPWRYVPNSTANDEGIPGAQIDLILKRNDNSVTLVEFKCNSTEIIINKQFAANLLAKAKIYTAATGTNDHVFIVMVTCAGVKPNNYSAEVLANQLVIDDLFA